MMAAEQITDRAKRYRANVETADWPRVCLFCGSTRDLQVDHIDGFEENGEAENLLILCRSCNQLKSAVYKSAGLGRRTVQYNPGLFSQLFGSKETYRTTGAAHPDSIKARKLDLEQKRLAQREREHEEREEARDRRRVEPKSVARYKGFTIYKRRESPYGDYIYYSTMDPDSWLDSTREAKALIDTFKNPASGLREWRNAVSVLRGDSSGSPFKAARVIRSTPIARRYQYLDQSMRSNPDVPSFAQYAWAVSQHVRGAYDEGGAIIHATPKSKRREYADRIADIKRGKREEVPF